MFPEELRLAPSEGVDSGLVISQAGKVPLGASVVEDVEEAHELTMNPAQGRHCINWEGVDICQYFTLRLNAGSSFTFSRFLVISFYKSLDLLL